MTHDEIKEWVKDVRNLGDKLPSYVLIKDTLFAGGQGIVYQGTVHDQLAAVKIYFPGVIEKRVDREVKALQSLQCSSIVTILWTGSINVADVKLPVMATSLVEGVPLDKALQASPLDSDSIGVVAYDCTAAIDAMWQRRIVHRDLKPSNIILRNDGRAVVIDLGVARHLGQSSLTAQGSFWGTSGYYSPEQWKAVRTLTCKSDLFALGVVLVEASLGRHPSHGDQQQLIALNLHKRLPDAVHNWKHARLLQRLLSPHPTMRPQPEEVLRTLREYRV